MFAGDTYLHAEPGQHGEEEEGPSDAAREGRGVVDVGDGREARLSAERRHFVLDPLRALFVFALKRAHGPQLHFSSPHHLRSDLGHLRLRGIRKPIVGKSSHVAVYNGMVL